MRLIHSVLFAFLLLLAAPFVFAQNTAREQFVLDLSAMDKSVVPCVDFYTYSCGGWMKKNPVPPDQSSWGTYGKLQDDNLAQLRGILEEAAKASYDKPTAAQKIGDYYASCMDTTAIDKLGAAPLKLELDRIAKMKLVEQLTLVTLQTAHHGSTSPRRGRTAATGAARAATAGYGDRRPGRRPVGAPRRAGRARRPLLRRGDGGLRARPHGGGAGRPLRPPGRLWIWPQAIPSQQPGIALRRNRQAIVPRASAEGQTDGQRDQWSGHDGGSSELR